MLFTLILIIVCFYLGSYALLAVGLFFAYLIQELKKLPTALKEMWKQIKDDIKLLLS